MSRSSLLAFAVLFSAVSPVHASLKYECWSYKGADLVKMTYVTANSKAEAQVLAEGKFKDIGVSFDEVKCK